MNQLPKDWKWVKLGNISEITSSRRIFQEEYVNEGIPFFRTKEIKELNEGKSISVELFITFDKYNEIKSKNEIPKIGDILISAVGTIGVSYIIKDSSPFYFKDGNLVWIRKLNGVIPKYLHFNFSHSIRFKQEITTSGSAYNALTIVKLKEHFIPLPPLPTQQTIVSKIEELFSELDKGVENLKITQQQLKTYRQAVLKWAFEGKLTNENVKEGELPKGWKNLSLGQMAKLSTLKHKPIKEEFFMSDWNTLKESGNLTSSVGIEKINTVKNKFSKNDILYGKLRPYLNKVYPSKEDGVCSTDILVFKAEKECNPKYLSLIMRSSHFVNDMSDNTSGVNLPRVSTKYVQNYLIALPPIGEQNKIVQEIESRLSVADKMEESITQSLQQAEALRQSILKKAFEGKLV